MSNPAGSSLDEEAIERLQAERMQIIGEAEYFMAALADPAGQMAQSLRSHHPNPAILSAEYIEKRLINLRHRLEDIDRILEPTRQGAHPLPKNVAEFSAFMNAIDADLVANKYPVPARGLHAQREASRRLKISLYGGPFANKVPNPNDFTGAALSQHINHWIEERYGEKQKVDFSIGSTVLTLRGDAWLISIPLSFGRVRVLFDRDLSKVYPAIAAPGTPNKEAMLNGLTMVRGLSTILAASLTDDEVNEIAEIFLLGQRVFSAMDHIGRSFPMVESACVDLRKAAEICVNDARSQGLSCWHSLQATEKLMKVLLYASGASFPKTHELIELNKLLRKHCGLVIDDALLALIQCPASVRYEPENTSQAEAVQSHSAAMQACHLLIPQIASRAPGPSP